MSRERRGAARSRERHGAARSRGRLLALVLVLGLAAGALVLGLERDDPPEATSAPVPAELTALRERADLEPCPAGLGPQLPDLVLPCLGGGPPVELRASPPGRPTLVNVWASWCAPCVDEVPDLTSFAERAGDRVGVVGVLTSDSQESALTFAEAFGMRWPSLVDDDGLVLRAFASGPPVTLFLDAEGAVVHRRSGAFTDQAEIEALVAEHLGVRL